MNARKKGKEFHAKILNKKKRKAILDFFLFNEIFHEFSSLTHIWVSSGVFWIREKETSVLQLFHIEYQHFIAAEVIFFL